MATSSVEALVLNSTMIQDADEDLVIQAKKAKNSASEKLKELKRKFEIKAAGTKAEIAVIKVRYIRKNLLLKLSLGKNRTLHYFFRK